jgi:MICOS complex subunit MIC60
LGCIFRLNNFFFKKLSEAKVHANILRSYTNEQKAARNQFLKEIQSLQPDGITSLNKTSGELSNEEINSLLIHAHKRVLQLQKQIENNQV